MTNQQVKFLFLGLFGIFLRFPRALTRIDSGKNHKGISKSYKEKVGLFFQSGLALSHCYQVQEVLHSVAKMGGYGVFVGLKTGFAVA